MVLEIARQMKKLKPQPKRSILFLMVTAEEQGLLGSQYYAEFPLYPLAEDARQHQHRRHQPVGTHERSHASSASARRISTTTRARPPTSRAACCGRTPSPRRASTTDPITSTSRRRACRRSIPTRASTSSASRPTTARRSATSTRRRLPRAVGSGEAGLGSDAARPKTASCSWRSATGSRRPTSSRSGSRATNSRPSETRCSGQVRTG